MIPSGHNDTPELDSYAYACIGSKTCDKVGADTHAGTCHRTNDAERSLFYAEVARGNS